MVFFALNLLIAVLTAPLGRIKEMSDLDSALMREIGDDIVAKKPESTPLDMLKWEVYSRAILPIVKVAFDARPVGSGYWGKWLLTTQALYPGGGASVTTLRRLEGCVELLRSSKGLDEKVKVWAENSPLCTYVIKNELIKGPASMALLLTAICAETECTVIRDARLMACVFGYARWVHGVTAVCRRGSSIA